jgi:hypothetical protein
MRNEPTAARQRETALNWLALLMLLALGIVWGPVRATEPAAPIPQRDSRSCPVVRSPLSAAAAPRAMS